MEETCEKTNIWIFEEMANLWIIFGDILSVLTIGSCLMWVTICHLCLLSILCSNFVLFLSSKLPQILTIYQQKSTQGLSLKSLTIEVCSYSVSTLYNFTNQYRLINYFEYIILIIQNYMLIAIVLFYRRQINSRTAAFTAVYVAVVALFAFSVLPKNILTLLIVSLRFFLEN